MSTSNRTRPATTLEDVRKVSPALEHYTRTSIEEGLWKRPGLSPREYRHGLCPDCAQSDGGNGALFQRRA
jgi:hypothetical protein